MKILISGFQPFGGEAINPSIEAVKRLPKEIDGHDVIGIEIPVEQYTSLKVLEDTIKIHQPNVVICVGQAGGRSDISIERIGINVDDYRIADNAGNSPIDETIVKDGPDAYFSTLPIKAIVSEIRKEGIPAEVSNSAGTYVCNHVMYGVSHMLRDTNIRSGFVHIPFLPQQVSDKPQYASMTLEVIVQALTIMIQTTIHTEEDIKQSEGNLD